MLDTDAINFDTGFIKETLYANINLTFKVFL